MTAVPQFNPEDHPRGFKGRFVETTRPEAQGVEPLKLFDRKDGTFLNPPASKTAEHCIEFWSTVTIPDEIVVAFRDAQRAEREQRIENERTDQEAFEAWYRQWIQSHPGATQAQYNAAWRRHVEEKNPSLAYQDASQAIRALQMVRRCPDEKRWADEAKKVYDHEIETWDGVVTALELCKQHKLIRVAGVLDRMPVQSDGLNPAILQSLQQLINETRGVRDEIGDVASDTDAMRYNGMTTSY